MRRRLSVIRVCDEEEKVAFRRSGTAVESWDSRTRLEEGRGGREQVSDESRGTARSN